jgi:hypothetical protein
VVAAGAGGGLGADLDTEALAEQEARTGKILAPGTAVGVSAQPGVREVIQEPAEHQPAATNFVLTDLGDRARTSGSRLHGSTPMITCHLPRKSHVASQDGQRPVPVRCYVARRECRRLRGTDMMPLLGLLVCSSPSLFRRWLAGLRQMNVAARGWATAVSATVLAAS